MKTPSSLLKGLAAALIAALFAACSIDVGGDLDARETGLPGYPGAEPARDGDRTESARVSVDTGWFGLAVAAAEYRTDDAPNDVLAFYRAAMRSYGTVTECRGDVEFRDRRPVCEANPSSAEVQLLAGREDDQRIVAVKPRGTGSEFALVHVSAKDR